MLYTHQQFNQVFAVAWSTKSSNQVASGDNHGVLSVWDASTGNNMLTYPGNVDAVQAIAWSLDGKRIAAGSNGLAQVWDATTANVVESYTAQSQSQYHYVRGVAWSPDGARIASASENGTVHVWEVATGKHLATHTHPSFVFAVAWSPNGTYVASGGGDNIVQIWDPATGETNISCQGSSLAVWSIAWSPDSKRIAAGSGDKRVYLWDAATGKLVLTYSKHTDWVRTIAWSPDGAQIASGAGAGGSPAPAVPDTTVQIWNATSGDRVYTFKGHNNVVNGVAWSADSQHIASGSWDTTVQVWQAR